MVQIVAKKRQPRVAKTQPYKKINSYTIPPSKEQILTIIIFLLLEVVHEVFVTSQIPHINQSILWTMFGFRYLLIVLILYDYIKLTFKDPVDRLIIDPDRRYKYNPYELRRCSICNTTVQCSSHHCMTCNRCTQDFDHHCKYLNNCIGVRNYEYFIRLLIVFVVFQVLGMMAGVWVLIQNGKSQFMSDGRKWVIIVYVVLAGLVAVVVASLLGFHVYISCCANITTLEFITTPKQQNKPQLNVIVIEPTPLSAEHFKKTFEGHSSNRNTYGVHVVSKAESEPMEYYRK